MNIDFCCLFLVLFFILFIYLFIYFNSLNQCESSKGLPPFGVWVGRSAVHSRKCPTYTFIVFVSWNLWHGSGDVLVGRAVPCNVGAAVIVGLWPCACARIAGARLLHDIALLLVCYCLRTLSVIYWCKRITKEAPHSDKAHYSRVSGRVPDILRPPHFLYLGPQAFLEPPIFGS